MKSMKDYVELEPKFYRDVLMNQDQLFGGFVDAAAKTKFDSVVIYATGSSSNAAYGARPFISKCLNVPVYIEEPSFNATYMLVPRKETLYIAISQGGHSFSTLKMIERLQNDGMSIAVLTSDVESPIGRTAKYVVNMGIPIEEMPYVTAGYAITILDLMLMSLNLGTEIKTITENDADSYLKQIETVIDHMNDVVLRSEAWVEQVKDNYFSANRLMFIGYGATYGVSREGETKVTETVRITAWGKELEEYMHGPYLGMHPSDHVIFIEPNGKLQERATKLKQFLDVHSVDTALISAKTDDRAGLQFGIQVDELLTSLFMTIPIHLLSFELSKMHGIDLTQSAYPDFDQITGSKI